MLRIPLMLLLLLLSACGGYQATTVQKDEVSYVKFVGDWKGVEVHIDNLEPIQLADQNKYGLAPGKHSIKVFRGERLLLNRVLFISDQEVREVRIP